MIRFIPAAFCIWALFPLRADEPKKEAAPLPAEGALPHYALTPGRELTYRGKTAVKYVPTDKRPERHENTMRDEITVWVLRTNADGSARVLCRTAHTNSHVIDGKQLPENTQVSVVYADIFPDGRILPNPTIQETSSPVRLFPPLPKSAAEAKTGWKSSTGDLDTVAEPQGDRFAAKRTVELWKRIYALENRATYTIDARRGLISKFEEELTQSTNVTKVTGTGLCELTAERTLPTAELADLSADAERYFAADEACNKALKFSEKLGVDKAKEILAKSLVDLKKAAATVSQADMKKMLAEKVTSHEKNIGYELENAQGRAEVLGNPAFAFDVKDLNGNRVTLEGLRGKVVVLDFWYRGCTWCVKAMPQMNELTAEFAGKPVAILGMNVDEEKGDAEFVAKEMGLKYATLRVERTVAAKYVFGGYPTLAIIDKKGILRELHVGYSDTLRRDVGKVIRDLLAE